MRRVAEWLLLLVVFLLPWQTVWIYGQAWIAGEPFSFGVMNVYVIEAILVLALACAGGLIWGPARGRSLRWIALFLVFALGSAVWSLDRELALSHWAHLAMAAALFIMVTFTRIDLHRIVWAFVLGLLLPVGLGVWQVIIGSSPAIMWLGLAARDAQTLGDAVLMVGGERILRAYGSFPHPNIFGGYLTMSLVGVGWLWQSASKKERIWLLVCSSVLFAGLILTFSRSAWLGLLVAGLVFIVIKHQQLPTSLRGWVAFVKGARLALACIVVVVALLSPFIASRFSSQESIEARSVSERIEQYGEFADVFEDHAIVGSGLHNYPLALAQADPGRGWWEYQPVHNSWLLLLAELGIIGFLVTCGLICSMMRVTTILPIGTIVITPLFVISLFDHYLWSLWPGLALVALSTACIVREVVRG